MKDVDRYVVAVASLGTTIDIEVKPLAADLGTTPYEARLKLVAGLPALVLATTDQAVAETLAGKLRVRGHRALVRRAADVVPASAMVQLRHFQIADTGLDASGAHLAWADIVALVRARHGHHSETTETVKQKRFNATRAILSGGLVMRKTEKREVVTRRDGFEQVLYLFRGDGGVPWILREHSTNYSALGSALEATATHNFAITIELFRKRAPHAVFDDSLLRRPSIDDVDLYADLIARGSRASESAKATE